MVDVFNRRYLQARYRRLFVLGYRSASNFQPLVYGRLFLTGSTSEHEKPSHVRSYTLARESRGVHDRA